MALLPLRLPEGVFRNGTRYQAKGRWYDTQLVQWVQGAMKPWKGWVGLGEGFETSTNYVLWSTELDRSVWLTSGGGAALWADGLWADGLWAVGMWSLGGGGDVTVTDTTSYFESPLTASQLDDDGMTAEAGVYQDLGVLTDSPETFSVFLEKISGATVTDVELRDATTGDPVLRLRLTWSTLAVAVQDTTDGSSEAVDVRHLGTGPNGGALVRVIGTVTPDNAGNDRELHIFPTGVSSAEAGVIVVHHAQHEEADHVGPVIFTTTTAVTQNNSRVRVDAPISGMLAWRDNSNVSRLSVGTPGHAYAYAEGVLQDITPTSFTIGESKATIQTGLYGAGPYGEGGYGFGDETLNTIVEGQSWQFDTWGEYLLALAFSDGRILEWQLDSGTPLEVVTNAPTGNAGIVVTPERFVFALGAGGNKRLVQWPDQEDNTVWTPASSNQAGDETLPGNGALLTGRRGRNETLLWTTTDFFSARYVGGNAVYRFDTIGEGRGLVSKRAVTMWDGKAYWMDHEGFALYDGVVRDVPCDVHDYIFSDINTQQTSLIHAAPNSKNGTITWFYPSSGSVQPNRYASLHVKKGTWSIGQLGRTAAVDHDVFRRPLMADRWGVVYEHERGNNYVEFFGDALVPFAETGPIEIAEGDQIAYISQIIPDQKSLGELSLTLESDLYPIADTPHQSVTYSAARPTPARISGRQFVLRITQLTPDWRFGAPRVNVVLGGER